jgi:hypothetical protein
MKVVAGSIMRSAHQEPSSRACGREFWAAESPRSGVRSSPHSARSGRNVIRAPWLIARTVGAPTATGGQLVISNRPTKSSGMKRFARHKRTGRLLDQTRTRRFSRLRRHLSRFGTPLVSPPFVVPNQAAAPRLHTREVPAGVSGKVSCGGNSVVGGTQLCPLESKKHSARPELIWTTVLD